MWVDFKDFSVITTESSDVSKVLWSSVSKVDERSSRISFIG